MRSLLFVTIILGALTPVAHAQSSVGTCQQVLAAVAAMSASYRGIADGLNDVPLGTMVSSLSGPEKEAAMALNDAHQVLRPALKAYVERLEDLTYALQQCVR